MGEITEKGGAYGAPDDWISVATRAAAIVARRRRLSRDDADDLRSEVWLKLLKDEHSALARFEARSSLLSYLIIIADRCVLDWHIRDLGKWRPSQKAQSAGPLAVQFERLTQRVGMSPTEAHETIRTMTGLNATDVHQALSELPRRGPSRKRASLDAVVALPCHDARPDIALERGRRAARAREIRRALRLGLSRISADDLELLTRRFIERETVATISRDTGHEQKGLYRRYDGLFRQLRDSLSAAGISASDIRALLADQQGPTGQLACGF